MILNFQTYAESTMNELLGWYGYDSSKNDSKVSRNRRSFSESNESEPESVKFTGKSDFISSDLLLNPPKILIYSKNAFVLCRLFYS